jgi:S1-C subfamily serine protease
MTRCLILLLVLLLLAAAAQAKRPARFVGKLRDGSQVEGEVLANWHTADAIPTLDGRPLLDPNNPLLWLRDRQLVAADSPAAFVELFSGDRLPGVALEYRGPVSGSPEQLFPHWLVRPAIAQRRPQSLDEPAVRVRAQFVRRIVWQRRSSNRYRPGTVFLRDGSSLPFRSARFDGEQVLLLLSAGTRRVLLSDMAELHLPARDFWQDYLDELAVLCPNPDTRLMQLETVDGLVATTSLDRLTVFAWGGGEHWRNWAHGIQPAWSLDVLFVPAAGVVTRRLFLPQDVPLSRIPPRESDRGSPATASAWPARVNRNVQGGTLHSGGREFGWGFGVHAFSQLQFPLTPLAVALRAELGLDRTVGDGGSIQGRIRAGDPASPPIFESGVLVGSKNVQSIGRIGLTVKPEVPGELVLVVDAAHDKRPPGADPFDVRDCADWLEPVLELNPEPLREELRRHSPLHVSAWEGWLAAIGPAATWPSLLREFPNRPATFLRCVSTAKEPLVLSRQLKLTPQDRWLLMSVGQDRAQQGRPHVQLLLDGELVFDQEIPFSDKWRNEVDPLIVPLQDYLHAGPREVQAEIRQVPGEQETPVAWQGIVLVERLPMIRTLFEDDGQFVALPPEPSEASPAEAATPAAAPPPPAPPAAASPAKLVTEDRQSGVKAVLLPSGPRYQLDLRGSLAVRERPAWGEFRFLRFAFRKQGAGRICVQLDHRQSQERPARYDAGLGEPCYPQARRVQDGALPDQWAVITRDLYADFGPLDLDGITLSAPDGQQVLFDQIYLARTVDDFRLIPQRRATDPAAEEAQRTALAAVQERVLPATVVIDFGDGRIGTGTIVSGEGDVLTAGHLVIAPNRNAKVTLADGRTLDAQTKGVCRDLDAGLVKITVPGPFPAVEVENFTQLNAEEFYVAVARQPKPDAGAVPAVQSTHVRRIVGQQLWTDFDPPDGTAGGGLLNRWGKLVGVHAGRSRFGGAVYGQLTNAQSFLGRLKNGEVWGRWLRGSSPVTGAVLTSSPDGLKILSLADKSPAAQAGLQPGDIVVRIDGKPSQVPDDLYQAVAEKDSGAALPIEFRRSGNAGTVNVPLSPRIP